MRVTHVLLLGIVSAAWSTFLLHKKSASMHPQLTFEQGTINDEPIISSPGFIQQNSSQIMNYLTINNDDTTNHIGATADLETILIIATVPYTAEHVMALWTHLECVTSGIDRVLISAPDTDWSKEIVSSVISQFKELQRSSLMGANSDTAERSDEATNNNMINIEAAYYTNNRYDVGLWCDMIGLHLGFDGQHFPTGNTSVANGGGARRRAIFLTNDSSVAIRRYESLINKIVVSAQMEQQQEKMGNNNETQQHNVKLVSLNGNLVAPNTDTKNYWVESVYRGLTPNAIPTFYQHSCVPEAARACKGLTGNGKKRCIVNRYEMSLADSFHHLEVDAMYPTYLPAEWDASAWEADGGIIGPKGMCW